LRLGDEHTVEGISVVLRETSGNNGMLSRNCQRLKSIRRYIREQIKRYSQASNRRF
jgi:hypothetical protein